MTTRKLGWARVAALVTLIACFAATTSWAKTEVRDGEIIIKFKDSATPSERSAIEHDLGMSQIKHLDLIHAEHAHVSGTVDDAIARYKQNPKVAYIEPNYVYRASTVPNDPSFPQLWGLQNTGQTGGKPGADISATSAWSQTTGSSSVLVAITDTGLDYNHPDLAANVWVNPGEIPGNGIDDDGNGFIDDVHGYDFVNNDGDPIDDNGHGTHVAGTIGAVGNNGVGVVGVNWHVSIMPVKFLDAFGSGSTTNAVSCIQYAVLMGARVISASWGGGGPSQALEDAIDAAGQAGILFVAAAGNAGSNTDVFPNYPSSYDLDNIIAVAATDHNDQLASFSNYGVVSVDLAAPGVDIYSTLPGGYGLLSGTSMATPHVTGAVALILARFPGITGQSAKNLLLSKVDPLPNLAGVVATGGRLNAFMPIAEPDSTRPAPITTLSTTNPQGTHITLQWIATGDDSLTGTASTYDVRYSTSPIDDANFASATRAPSPPSPLPAGTPQSMRVDSLTFSTSYFFAIKALDEFGNSSTISNIATGATLPPPIVGVSPSQLSASLLTDEQTTQTLTISNTGPSELNFKIDVVSNANAAVRTTGRIVRTFSLTSSPGETPPPSYPLSTVPYERGHSAGRGTLGAGDIRITNTFAAGLRILILHSGGDVSEIRSLLAAFPDVGVVDVFDGTGVAPTLATLTSYHAVIVANNVAFGDPVGTGNVLADYVDQGGGVVMTLASFIAGWDIRGRFQTGGYMPYNLGSGPSSGSSLGAFDPTHPIMAGVQAAFGDLLGILGLAPGASLVASWANGQPCVATKGTVAGVNVFVGVGGYWSGDVPLMLHNAAFWSSRAATWVSTDPQRGVVPAGSQLGVVVTFDASDLFGGDYDAALEVHSDDPVQPSVAVPAHLHVTGAPNISVAGEDITIESIQNYGAVGGHTNHDLAIDVPPSAGGSLELIADGDYGDFGETATATAEGTVLGSVGQVGVDCVPASGTFPLTAAQLGALAADGVVHVQVQNTNIVDLFCVTNRHTVRLHYAQPADQIDFGPVFVGGTRNRMLVIKNVGTDMLHVTSIASSNPAFTPNLGSAFIPPNVSDSVFVAFQPPTATTFQGTLTITSDDPDQGVITVSLSGEGLVPPDIDVSPTSVSADLLTGQSQTRSVTVRNTGGSNLSFSVDVSGPGIAVRVEPRPGHPGPVPIAVDRIKANAPGGGPVSLDEAAVTSNAIPAGYQRVSSPEVRMSGARVLIVQDAAPWGTSANQQVLNNNGIDFDMIPSSLLQVTDLSSYRLVIVPSDQTSNYYATVSSQVSKLESFVTSGGVLEVHAAGWGWQGGDASLMTIPGGMHIAPYAADYNYVLDASHPLMLGVPNPFSGTAASHAYFTQIPANASAIATDDANHPDLVVYPIGLGKVVAGCQTFEFGFANGQDPGLILRNMIPFTYQPGPVWLSADPTSGTVPPGGSAIVTVTFDATGLNGGDYDGNVHVRSNDPDESDIAVSAHLHVTGAPDLRLTGQLVSVESTKSFDTPLAVTTHHLVVPSTTQGPATLTLDIDGDYGDFTETASVSVEGIPLGDVGRLGQDCIQGHGTFQIDAATMATLVADGAVDVQVQNSFDVDLFCGLNQHHVKLTYPGPVDPIDFGSLFVGLCSTQILDLRNVGTDVLSVTDLHVDNANFTVSPSSATLLPGQHDSVTVTFCPQSAQPIQGTLTITSNDPDQGSLQLALKGVGLVPPDIDVAPTSLSDNLLSGQTHAQTLTVRNLGGSDLVLKVDVQGPAAAIMVQPRPGSPQPVPIATDHVMAGPGHTAAAALDEPGPVRTDQTPTGYRFAAVPSVHMAGAQVLIVEDTPPWGTLSNEMILDTLGIAFDMIPSSLFAGTNLSPYKLMIIPSDQPSTYYSVMSGQLDKLETFVNGGGVLEAHSAGWGFAGGNAGLMTLPGGMHIEEYLSSVNTILDASHPLMAGVPNPITGNLASHAHFTSIPAGAQRLVADESGTPNLVVYQQGLGLVVAAGQTLEFGFANHQAAGQILRNMIPFSYRPGPRWLSVNPTDATVPAGGAATITVLFNATDLLGGDYSGNVRITSNDPDESIVMVPASLHVTGVPNLVVSGKQYSVESTQNYTTSGAMTTHHLQVGSDVSGTAELQLDIDGDYGDFVETATVFAEGMRLGEVGRLGVDCSGGSGTFPISASQFAQLAADGVVDVVVQNSFDVDVFCAINRHHVTLRYRGTVNPVEFGSLFVGNCTSQPIQVSNRGTDVLVVSDIRGSSPAFSASPTSFSLDPGQARDVTVSFCPVAAGDVTGTVTLVSNDPDGDTPVSLHGIGVVPPDIALAHGALSEDLMVGQSSHRSFGIANHGGSDLAVRLNLRLPAAALLAGSDEGVRSRSENPSAPIDLSAMRDRYEAFAQSGAPASSGSRSDGPKGEPAPAPRAVPSATGVVMTAAAAETPVPSVSPIFYDDFEGPDQGWSHHADGPDSLDLWALSTNRSSSGARSWRVSQHTGAGSDALESPPISLEGYQDATLVFRQWYMFDDCGVDFYEPDGGLVECRVGNGPWVQIDPILGYPNILDVTCGNPLQTRHAYAHDGRHGASFINAVFDLTPFAGQTIQFRFHAGWDCGNCENDEGWYVDDVLVYSNRARWISVSPIQATIPPGHVQDFDFGFDATELTPGRYDAVLDITSNDPDESLVSVPVRLQVANVSGNVDVDPNSLNLGSHGQMVTTYIELPPGHDLGEIVVPDVTLNGIPSVQNIQAIGDNDHDGLPDIMVKFDRDLVRGALDEGDDVRIAVGGDIGGGNRFLAFDKIKVIRQHVTSPVSGEVVVAGSSYVVRWDVPGAWNPTYAELAYTVDEGITWTPIATNVQGTSYTWSVPNIAASSVRVRVGLFDAGGLLSYDSSQGVFQIQQATADVITPAGPPRKMLLQNVPNPFLSGRSTSIAYELSAASPVSLAIYSPSGRLVRVLVQGSLAAGRHQVAWDGRDGNGRLVGPGVYFVQMKAGTFTASRTMAMLR